MKSHVRFVMFDGTSWEK